MIDQGFVPSASIPTLSGPPAIVRFGKYELLAALGQGGMAQVFLARHRGPMGFEKLLVIKKIHPHLAHQQQFIDMFLDEARLAARINDPRVVQIYELGQVGHMYFMAMEYLVGESLAAIIKSGIKRGLSLRPRIAARIVAEAAGGLHAAHELQSLAGQPLEVVHRDMSPGNIVVLYDGHVKVVDFGVAKAKNKVAQTVDGEVKGKFAYMSPEQLTNKQVDRRSDVFSLGVVLWESLALRRLFRADSHGATVMAIVSGDTVPPSHYRKGIPPELDHIALRALARNPDERFQTADALRMALEDYLHTSGERVDVKDIKSCLEELFAERIRARSRILERVASLGEATIEVAAPSLVTEFEDSESSSLALPWSIGDMDVDDDALTLLRGEVVDEDDSHSDVANVELGQREAEVGATLPDSSPAMMETLPDPAPAGEAKFVEAVTLPDTRAFDRKATLVGQRAPSFEEPGESEASEVGEADDAMPLPDELPGLEKPRRRVSPIWILLAALAIVAGTVTGVAVMGWFPGGSGDEVAARSGDERADERDEESGDFEDEDDGPSGEDESTEGVDDGDEGEDEAAGDGDEGEDEVAGDGDEGEDETTADGDEGEEAAGSGSEVAKTIEPVAPPPKGGKKKSTARVGKKRVPPAGAEPKKTKGTAKKKGAGAAAVPKKGRGRLFLATEPKATIFAGRKRLGETPLMGISLPAGTHSLTAVRKEAGVRSSFKVVIEAGKETRLLKKL